MNVVITDIASKPGHDPVRSHKTGRFQRGFFVCPASIVVEGHARKVVLGIEEVASHSARNEVRDELSQQQCLPANEQGERYPDHNVHHQSQQAIIVFPRMIEKRINAHPVEEHENIAEQDGQRVAHEQVQNALPLR